MCSRGTSELSCLLVQGSNQRERSYKCGAGGTTERKQIMWCEWAGHLAEQASNSERSLSQCTLLSLQCAGLRKFTGRDQAEVHRPENFDDDSGRTAIGRNQPETISKMGNSAVLQAVCAQRAKSAERLRETSSRLIGIASPWAERALTKHAAQLRVEGTWDFTEWRTSRADM